MKIVSDIHLLFHHNKFSFYPTLNFIDGSLEILPRRQRLVCWHWLVQSGCGTKGKQKKQQECKAARPATTSIGQAASSPLQPTTKYIRNKSTKFVGLLFLKQHFVHWNIFKMNSTCTRHIKWRNCVIYSFSDKYNIDRFFCKKTGYQMVAYLHIHVGDVLQQIV